jgi:hypothetical protein
MRLKLASLAFTCALAVLLLGSSTGAAHAYLDAGTGSMILQLLLGGVAGLALVGKLYWHRFLVMVGVRKDEPVDPTNDKAQAHADR